MAIAMSTGKQNIDF